MPMELYIVALVEIVELYIVALVEIVASVEP